jgi:cation transport ATPase
MAKRDSRKRRRSRGASVGAKPVATPANGAPVSAPHESRTDAPVPDPSTSLQRGYARGRAKDDAARAALVPLDPGERPLAVTVGAIAAALLAASNLIALAFGYNANEGRLTAGTVLAAGVLALVAWGMWQARYWAVLGMQTLLAITIVFAGLALLTAYNWWAAVLMVIIIALAGTLFWFLVKAMARIQMPQPPSASR